MRLVHMCLVSQLLGFIQQNQVYAQLHKSGEKNAYAYFCLTQTHTVLVVNLHRVLCENGSNRKKIDHLHFPRCWLNLVKAPLYAWPEPIIDTTCICFCAQSRSQSLFTSSTLFIRASDSKAIWLNTPIRCFLNPEFYEKCTAQRWEWAPTAWGHMVQCVN